MTIQKVRRILGWVLLLPALPLALWACTAHPLEEPKPATEQETGLRHELNPIRDLDILVMVDNSHSMLAEQDKLSRNFPALMGELEKIPGGMPNVHIAVVSSDMGAGPSAGNCRPLGDRGLFRAPPGCGLEPGARFIVSRDNGTTNNFTGKLGDVFKCMASLGTSGCGYEHQLQSLRVALYDKLAPENAGFLRENANLAIIILSDEDDCSGEPDSPLYTPTDYGMTEASFRCAREGHLCGGKTPPIDARFSAPLSECRSNEEGKLLKVRDIVKSIKALKKRPDQQILVSAIIGLPDDPAAARYAYTLKTGGGVDYGQICATPGSPQETATAGLRLKEFVEGFGDNGGLHTICASDFRPAMQKIGKLFGRDFQPPCIPAPLVDTRPEAGLQAECAIIDYVPHGETTRPQPVGECGHPAVAAGQPCWKLEADPVCQASGYKLTVDRKGQMPPAGAVQSIKCLTRT